ncbi:ATP-grasp fold amidoligase family protein [uncultured Algibacter sp.]|uniref:ATP-grasp fold amidoligase family protein n=1 Tax=uncultured Algibacter sp. TaxID=298659 RepID=UPI0026331251|nr:ATP-grasp fold amidoligase family protein [uncultured Algibacter sp.]
MTKLFQIIKKKAKRNHLVLLRKLKFVSPETYVHYLYSYYTGKKLDLVNPKEFNEKIQWYKVHFHPKILNQLVDKYAVRAYVKDKIGAQYLNDIYGVYKKPEEVPFNELPKQYVIKATNTSGYNLIVTDKENLDKKKTRKLLKKWLSKTQYYLRSREWAYKDVEPRLVVEKFLKEEGKSSLVDYKFYCFDGVAKFVDVHIDRDKEHKQGCFDLDFNLLPFGKSINYKSISSGLAKPTNFDEMAELSQTLAANLPFVRVDFYSVNGNSIFGEMTFYPSGGRKDFFPDKYNKIIGDYFKLPKLKKGQKIITEID